MISNEDLLNLIITKLKKITNELVNRTALANTVLHIMQLEIMQFRKLIIQGLEKIVG